MAKARLLYMEGFNSAHLKIRYLHDKTYSKNKTYKKWTDTKYSSALHRSVLIAFILSFVFFQGFQYFFPYFNMWNPTEVRAGANTKTWTTTEDFSGGVINPSYLAVSGSGEGGYLRLNVDESLSSLDANLGTGAQGDVTINSSVNINTLVAGYNPGAGVVPNFRNLTITPTGTLTTSQGVPLELRVSENLIIESGGKIDATGMGYQGGGLGNQTYGGYYLAQPGFGPGGGGRGFGGEYDAGGGGGGGYGSVGGLGGVLGWDGGGGAGGPAYSNFPAFGSGGGSAAGFFYSNNFGNGGAGGGIVKINAQNISLSGNILASGLAGSENNYGLWGSGHGGGGSGGSVFIYTPNTLNNINNVIAIGGVGGNSSRSCPNEGTGGGGGGAGGRIKIVSSIDGNTPNLSTTVRGGLGGIECITSRAGSGGTGTYNKMGIIKNGEASGYRVTVAAPVKPSWSTISFNGNQDPNGASPTFIKFQTRGTNVTNPNESTPVNQVDPNNGWTTWQNVVGSNIQTQSTQTLEVKVILESNSGINTPTLNDFTVTYDTLEAPVNNNLILTKTDGTALKNNSGTTITGGVSGAYTNESSLKVTANNLTCGGGTSGQPQCAVASTNLRPEVQASTAPDFSNPISAIATQGTNYATLTGLSDGSSYYLRARAIDDEGRVSGWTNYGGTTPDTADITVEQGVPSGTVTIGGPNVTGNYSKSRDVTLTISATDNGAVKSSPNAANLQMRLSNDGIFDSSPIETWQAYSTTKEWQLADNDGPKTVYAQYRDNAGNMSGNIQTSSADFSSVNPGGSIGGGLVTDGNDLRLFDGNFPSSTWYFKAPYTAPETGLSMIAPSPGAEVWSEHNEGPEVTIRYRVNQGVWIDATPNPIVVSVPSGGINSIGYSISGSDGGTGRDFFLPGIYKFSTGQNISLYFYPSSFPTPGAPAYTSHSFNIGSARVVGDVVSEMPATSTYTSRVFGNGSSTHTSLFWNDFAPGGSTLSYEIKAGPNEDASGGIGWTSISKSQEFSTINGWNNTFKYLQYRVILSSGTNQTITPYVYDVALGSSTPSNSIILDTQKPSDVTNLKAYNDSGKTAEYASGSWQSDAAPYFEWSVATDGGTGVGGYRYCFSVVAGCEPTTELNNNTYKQISPALEDDGNYTFKVVAYDLAGNTSNTPTTFNYGLDINQITVQAPAASSNIIEYIDVNWTAATDAGSPVTNYQLERVRKKDYDDYLLTPTGTWDVVGEMPVPSFAQINCATGTRFRDYPTTGVVGIGQTCTLAVGEPVASSVAYYYRLRAKDTAHQDTWSAWAYQGTPGLTRDGTAPSDPSNVQAVPNGDFAVAITWDAAVDEGTGVARYDIYRARVDEEEAADDYEIIGYVENVIPYTLQWNDNDQKNAEFDGTIKVAASDQLIDNAEYYYRVIAIDGSNNKSQVMSTIHPYNNPLGTINRDSVTTDDATAPTIRQISSVTPNNISEIQVDWSHWPDVSSRDANVSGVGVASYEIQRRVEGSATWTTLSDADNNATNNQFVDNEFDNYDTYGEFSTLSGAMTEGSPANGGSLTLVNGGSYPAFGRIKIGDEYIDYGSRNGNILQNITRGKLDSATVAHDAGETVYLIDRFQSLTYYYYKMRATDLAGNISGYTTTDPAAENAKTRTPDATAPSVPKEVDADAYKEAPNLNGDPGDSANNYKIANYGHMMTVSWKGAQDNSKISGYILYRSEQNPEGVSAATWKSAATLLATITLSGETDFDERAITYTYIDNNETNAATAPAVTRSESGPTITVAKEVTPNLIDARPYYYRVLAVDDANPEQLQSSLSSPSTTTTRASDFLPDATPPETPIDVKLHPIWGATEDDFRFVITWKAVATPSRNGENDFKAYRLYRSTDGVSFSQVLVNGQNPLYNESSEIAIKQNYYVDSEATLDATYYYYVTSADNASIAFRYPNPPYSGAPIISNHDNESVKSAVVSQNPRTITPVIESLDGDGLKAEVTSRGVSTATIRWVTDQPTASLVEYRKAGTNDPFEGAYSSALVTEHIIEIRGLTAGTDYEYRVSGKNVVGYESRAGAGIEGANANVEPLSTVTFSITNVEVSEKSTTGATITWDTANLSSDSTVFYYECAFGTTTNCLFKPGRTSAERVTTGHKIILDNLKPDTLYIYSIRSVSDSSDVAEKTTGTDNQLLTFRTNPYDTTQFTIAPSASDIAQENITATSAKIVWNTAIQTDTRVDYGTSSGNYNQSKGDDNFNTVHVVELRNLTPGTTYYYVVRGKDANGFEYTSKEYSFTAVLQPEIAGLKVNLIDSYNAVITFNTNVDTESSVTFGKAGNLDLKAGSTELRRNHVINLENLEDATTYSYFVEVRDNLGNTKKTEVATFSTPLDKTGASVENLKIDMLPMGESDEYAQIIISWNTNKPTSTKIEYDEGMISGKYGKSTIEDTTLSTSHTVIIKDLNPSSTYHFRIAGKDKRGNQTNSQDYNFVTPEKNKSVWQLIVRSLEETFSWVKNVGGFFQNIGKKTN